jgi:hypothetical protein
MFSVKTKALSSNIRFGQVLLGPLCKYVPAIF